MSTYPLYACDVCEDTGRCEAFSDHFDPRYGHWTTDTVVDCEDCPRCSECTDVVRWQANPFYDSFNGEWFCDAECWRNYLTEGLNSGAINPAQQIQYVTEWVAHWGPDLAPSNIEMACEVVSFLVRRAADFLARKVA